MHFFNADFQIPKPEICKKNIETFVGKFVYQLKTQNETEIH